MYLDAAHTQLFNGGWNWYSFAPTASGAVSMGFAVFPNGSVNQLTYCANGLPGAAPPTTTTTTTPPPPTPPATGNLLGYIKMSVGPYQACDDASSTGRINIYGTGIANDNVLYTDAAMTQPYNGGWNWFSFTAVLGGPTTYAFAIYPSGGILLLRTCGSATARTATAANATTAEQDIATLKTLKDAAGAAAVTIPKSRLVLYPNPVQSIATVEFYSADNSVKTISLYDSKGVLKSKYTWQTIQGNNVFLLNDLAALSNGLYIVEIRDNKGRPAGTLKFLKVR